MSRMKEWDCNRWIYKWCWFYARWSFKSSHTEEAIYCCMGKLRELGGSWHCQSIFCCKPHIASSEIWNWSFIYVTVTPWHEWIWCLFLSSFLHKLFVFIGPHPGIVNVWPKNGPEKYTHICAKPLYHARCQKCPGMQQLNHSSGNFSSCQDFVCMGKCRNCPQRPDFSPAGGFGPDFCDVRQTSTFCYILWQSPLLPSPDKLLCHNWEGIWAKLFKFTEKWQVHKTRSGWTTK